MSTVASPNFSLLGIATSTTVPKKLFTMEKPVAEKEHVEVNESVYTRLNEIMNEKFEDLKKDMAASKVNFLLLLVFAIIFFCAFVEIYQT